MADNTVNDAFNRFADGSNEELIEFNKNYISYISQCTGNNAKTPQSNSCTELFGKLTVVDTGVSTLKDSITSYNNPKSSLLEIGYGNKPSAGALTTNDQYNKVIQDYGNVTKQRSDLDAKLRELYDIPGSKSLDFKYNYDSTVYSGILLTIIASGIIYYTFTKL